MCKILRYRPWLSQPNGEIEQVVYAHIVTGVPIVIFLCVHCNKKMWG